MKIEKLYLVELLRFLSSISVLIYHYQVYFFQYNKFNYIEILNNLKDLPFNFFLILFYKYGDYGVQMFWCISGFIISYVYIDKIKSVSAKNFFINRFSRLYPLHLLTLVFVLIVQQASNYITGDYQLFYLNDLYHFILHFFFISGWGFEKGMSFNEPIWSVSLELIAYFLFFIIVSNLKRLNIITTLTIYIIFFLINKNFYGSSDNHADLISCLQLFISGMIIFQLFKKMKKIHIIVFSLILLVLSIVGNFKIFMFCPAVLLIFLISEDYFKNMINKKFFSFLGNLTYSLYLIHSPVAMIIMIFFKSNTNIYFSYEFFLFYFTFLILNGALIYYYVEKKLQNSLRKYLK